MLYHPPSHVPCNVCNTPFCLSPVDNPAGKKDKAAAKKQDKQKQAKAAAAAAAEEVSEGGEEDQDDEGDGSDDEGGAGSSSKVMQVTSSLVEGWTQAALEKASLGAMMQLVKAYRCVVGGIFLRGVESWVFIRHGKTAMQTSIAKGGCRFDAWQASCVWWEWDYVQGCGKTGSGCV
jgi:hypothetical protein